MASLTETAVLMRTLIKIGILSLVVLILGFYAVRFTLKTFFTPKKVEATPNPTFHQLPPVKFPNQTARVDKISVELVSGMQDFGRIATVHALVHPKVTFRSKDQALVTANRLEFTSPPTQTTADNIQFVDDQLPLRTLRIDLALGHFLLKYDYKQNPSVLTRTKMQAFDEDQIKSRAIEFFKTARSYPQDLDNGIQTITYLAYDTTANELVITKRPQEADAIRVDFFRSDVGDHPIVYPNPPNSTTYVIFGPSIDQKKQILEARYAFYEVSEDTGTYPIKTGKQSLDEVAAGNAFIAQNDGGTNAAITDISLGYYESNFYLIPVYVFSGDGFTAYDVAITSDQFTDAGQSNQNQESQESVQGISTQNDPEPIFPNAPPLGTDRNSKVKQPKSSDLLY